MNMVAGGCTGPTSSCSAVTDGAVSSGFASVVDDDDVAPSGGAVTDGAEAEGALFLLLKRFACAICFCACSTSALVPRAGKASLSLANTGSLVHCQEPPTFFCVSSSACTSSSACIFIVCFGSLVNTGIDIATLSVNFHFLFRLLSFVACLFLKQTHQQPRPQSRCRH